MEIYPFKSVLFKSMKYCLICLLLLIAHLAYSTDRPQRSVTKNPGMEGYFSAGNIAVSGGFGAVNLTRIILTPVTNSLNSRWTSVNSKSSAIWFAKGEYGLSNHSGIGVSLAHTGFTIDAALPDSLTKLNIPVSGKFTYKTTSILVRYNYHFIPDSKLDIYIGTGLGLRLNHFKVEDNDPDKDWWNFPVDLGFVNRIIPKSLSLPTFGGELTTGIRYMTDFHLGLYAEFGIAKSVAQFGATVAF